MTFVAWLWSRAAQKAGTSSKFYKPASAGKALHQPAQLEVLGGRRAVSAAGWLMEASDKQTGRLFRGDEPGA